MLFVGTSYLAANGIDRGARLLGIYLLAEMPQLGQPAINLPSMQ